MFNHRRLLQKFTCYLRLLIHLNRIFRLFAAQREAEKKEKKQKSLEKRISALQREQAEDEVKAAKKIEEDNV